MKTINVNQLNSTNIYHLQGIVTGAERLPGVTRVLHSLHSPRLKHSVIVDIVCNEGQTWVKVIARNAKALASDIDERQEFGSKSIVEQAEEYQYLAQLHQFNFTTPNIILVFCNVVFPPTAIVSMLAHRNVLVKSSFDLALPPTDLELTCPANIQSADGRTLRESLSCQVTACNSSTDCVEAAAVTKVNLDITTLIALTSNVCNGACNFVFTDDILTQQAAEERLHPSLLILQRHLNNKQLLVCESALNDFMAILNVVGGPAEKERAHRLLETLTIVTDCPSPRAQQLRVTSHIKSRALTIFGTGDSHQAATATANHRFVRAASQAGVDFVVFVHPARALTECKEKTATKLVAN
jgi:hypothetical protein